MSFKNEKQRKAYFARLRVGAYWRFRNMGFKPKFAKKLTRGVVAYATVDQIKRGE